MILKPADHAIDEVDAVRRRGDAQHHVRPARVAHELGFAPRLAERDEHLLTLTDGAAIVGLALHDQGGCPGAVRECRWRMRCESLACLMRLAAPLVRAPRVRD